MRTLPSENLVFDLLSFIVLASFEEGWQDIARPTSG